MSMAPMDGKPSTAYLSNFTAFLAADGADNKTALSFDYVDEGSGMSTSCRLEPNSSVPIYTIPGTLARYPCENRLLEFSWVTEDWRGKDQLWLFETSCPPPGVTDPQGQAVTEASGRVLVNMTCTEAPADCGLGPGRKCNSPGFTAKFTSLGPRPH